MLLLMAEGYAPPMPHPKPASPNRAAVISGRGPALSPPNHRSSSAPPSKATCSPPPWNDEPAPVPFHLQDQELGSDRWIPLAPPPDFRCSAEGGAKWLRSANPSPVPGSPQTHRPAIENTMRPPLPYSRRLPSARGNKCVFLTLGFKMGSYRNFPAGANRLEIHRPPTPSKLGSFRKHLADPSAGSAPPRHPKCHQTLRSPPPLPDFLRLPSTRRNKCVFLNISRKMGSFRTFAAMPLRSGKPARQPSPGPQNWLRSAISLPAPTGNVTRLAVASKALPTPANLEGRKPEDHVPSYFAEDAGCHRTMGN